MSNQERSLIELTTVEERHLKVLGEAGVISEERRGTWMSYQVRPAVPATLSAVPVPAASAA